MKTEKSFTDSNFRHFGTKFHPLSREKSLKRKAPFLFQKQSPSFTFCFSSLFITDSKGKANSWTCLAVGNIAEAKNIIKKNAKGKRRKN